MSRPLREVLEELCPGVYERTVSRMIVRNPDACMHGLKMDECPSPTCKEIAQQTKEQGR